MRGDMAELQAQNDTLKAQLEASKAANVDLGRKYGSWVKRCKAQARIIDRLKRSIEVLTPQPQVLPPPKEAHPHKILDYAPPELGGLFEWFMALPDDQLEKVWVAAVAVQFEDMPVIYGALCRTLAVVRSLYRKRLGVDTDIDRRLLGIADQVAPPPDTR